MDIKYLSGTLIALFKSILVINLLMESLNAHSQVTYITKFRSEAESKIFVTSLKHEADIILYATKYRSNSNPEKGVIYFTEIRSQAEWKIYLTKVKSEADCILYYTPYRWEAKRNDCYFNLKPFDKKR